MVACAQCSKPTEKALRDISESKSGKNFCSRSCAATYNNTHKTIGTRVSKLEIWLATKLVKLYPTIEFHFNRKDAINSELDIYLPNFDVAFELNGLFHYEPIYGPDKLAQIQNNDTRKFQACLERGIELCIIDTTSMQKFKEHKATKFLEVVCSVINKKTI